MNNLTQKALVAGLYASVIGLVFGAAVGGLGAWQAVAAASKTPIGGVFVLLLIGSIFGYLYSFIGFDKWFKKEALVKGAAYGVLIWIATLIVAGIFPVAGETAFSQPLRAGLFVQLLTHLVWGASLGLLYEQR